MEHLNQKIQALLDLKEIQDFLNTVHVFINLIENLTINQADFYPQIHKALTSLYQAGLSIPLVYSEPKFNFKHFFKQQPKNKNQNANQCLKTNHIPKMLSKP